MYVWGSARRCIHAEVRGQILTITGILGIELRLSALAPSARTCRVILPVPERYVYFYINTVFRWSENIDFMVAPKPPRALCSSLNKPFLCSREHIPGPSFEQMKKEPQCLPCRCWGQRASVKLKIARRGIVIKAWGD